MSYRWTVILVVAVAAIGAVGFLVWPRVTQAPVAEQQLPGEVAEPRPVSDSTVAPVAAATTYVRAADIADADAAFEFGATVPRAWQVEAVSGSAALSFFDPAAQGDTTLDKSHIFIRSFSANDFLTLQTVDIHAQEATAVNGRPAVRYDITKKDSAPVFSAQPVWRNQRHVVTDVRVTDTNPSIFYVIAKRPSLNAATYEQFLASFEVIATEQVTTQPQGAGLIAPVAEFSSRITKKPFGIHITPATSPVSPERFSGYHTGVDVEYGDVEADVPVRAIAAGKVVAARTAEGYGGMVAVQHVIDNQETVGIYGHLRPSALLEVGQEVTAGQQLAVLGTGATNETDGERKHLHFALVIGTAVDIRGYVSTAAELTNWLDPADLDWGE